MRSWESLVTAEAHVVNLSGAVLRNSIPSRARSGTRFTMRLPTQPFIVGTLDGAPAQ